MDANQLSMFLQTVAPLGGLLNGVAPGLGTAATAGIEGLASLSANKANRAAQALVPPENDPIISNYLKEIDRRKRTFENGSAYAAQARELKNQQSAAQQGVIRVAGGNTGAAISGLSRTQQNTGNAYGNIVAQGTQREDNYEQMYGNMLNDMAQRRLGIQMMRYSQLQQDTRQNQANTSQQLMNLLGVMKPVDFKKLFGDGSSLPQPQSSTPPRYDLTPTVDPVTGVQNMNPYYPQVNLPQQNDYLTAGNTPFNNQVAVQ